MSILGINLAVEPDMRFHDSLYAECGLSTHLQHQISQAAGSSRHLWRSLPAGTNTRKPRFASLAEPKRHCSYIRCVKRVNAGRKS